MSEKQYAVCYKDYGLVTEEDSWRFMRIYPAGTTLDFYIKEELLYDHSRRRVTPFDYIGLYQDRSIRAIGKIVARIVAVDTPEGMMFQSEFGDLTKERKEKILLAMKNATRYHYDLRSEKHRYFFVDHFYETDFKKGMKDAEKVFHHPMSPRIMNLAQILGIDEPISTEEIALLLNGKTWV